MSRSLVAILLLACASAAGEQDLRAALHETRWIAFAPTGFDPTRRPPRLPSEASQRADLETLRRAGFDGLVLYGSMQPDIPRLAAESGFRRVLVGVWDPADEAEVAAAIRTAELDVVLGCIVGNEGLMFKRYDLATLGRAMRHVRDATGKPVSTTEVIDRYATTPEIVEWSTFLAPNAHPFHFSVREPEDAVRWTQEAYGALAKLARGRPILLKEVGLPTAGAEAMSEERQAEYYARLDATEVPFAFFEYADGPWKTGGTVEPHWGLFRADRTPKPVVKRLTGRLFLSPLDLARPFAEGVKVERRPHPKDPRPVCWRIACAPNRSGEVEWRLARPLDATPYRTLTLLARGARGGERIRLTVGERIELRPLRLGRTWVRRTVDLARVDRARWSRVLRCKVETRGAEVYLADVWLDG